MSSKLYRDFMTGKISVSELRELFKKPERAKNEGVNYKLKEVNKNEKN